MPGRLGVGGVRHEQVDADLAELGERAVVGQAPVDRRLIELEVAGVDDVAHRRADEHADRVGDGVVHGEEVEAEGAERDVAAVLDLAQLGLLELVLSSLPWMRPSVSWVPSTGTGAQRLEQVRQSAGVVLVTVGDDDGAQLVLALHDVGEVGKDEVDPGMVVVGEHDSGVDDDHVVAVLDDGHVLADLVKPAERDDAEAILLLRHAVRRVSFRPLLRSFGRRMCAAYLGRATATGRRRVSIIVRRARASGRCDSATRQASTPTCRMTRSSSAVCASDASMSGSLQPPTGNP